MSNPLAHLRAARSFLDRTRGTAIPDHCGVTVLWRCNRFAGLVSKSAIEESAAKPRPHFDPDRAVAARWRDRRRGLPVAAAPRALTPDRVLAAAIEQAYGRPLPTLKELRAALQTPRRPAQRSRSIQSRGPLGTGPWRPFEGRSPGRALYQLAASSRINLARRWQACGNFERRGRSRGPVPDTAPLTLRAN